MNNHWKVTIFLLLAAASAQAETETGLINLTTFSTGTSPEDGVAVTMKTPSSTLAGLCGANGVYLPLNGDASKAAYSALLAAVVSGKSITMSYEHNAVTNECLLRSARVE